jgi:predicted O-methyltransferase YrrM
MRSPASEKTKLRHIPRDWLRNARNAARRFLFGPSIEGSGNLRLRKAILIETIVKARPGTRMAAFKHLCASLSVPRPASSAANCEITSAADFESSYGQLAALLGYRGKSLPPGDIEFARRICADQPVYNGRTGINDCLFLFALVSVIAPTRVVEVGTLGGYSAAVIASALHRQQAKDRLSRVDTIDVSSRFLIDERLPTGFEIAESYPELVPMIRLHVPHDSSVIPQLADYNELEVVYIDADHRHPMPLLDLLRLAPYVKTGGWVVLHDIRLGSMGCEAREPGHMGGQAPYGAEWLFHYWPFPKISGGNIGAIQIPNKKSELVPLAVRLMSLPFEIEAKHARSASRALRRSFEELIGSSG